MPYSRTLCKLLLFLSFTFLMAQEESEEALLKILRSEQYHLSVKDYHTLSLEAKERKITLLIKLLQNKKYWLVRLRSAEALGKIGKEAKRSIPNLIQATKDSYEYVATMSVWALGEMGTEGKEAIPRLIETLGSKEYIIAGQTAKSLRKMGTYAKAAIPALIKALDYNYNDVRYEAVITLGKLKAKEAIPGLIKKLQDPDKKVQQKAIAVLGNLEAAEALTSFLTLLSENKDPKTRLQIVKAINRMGDKAKKAHSSLLPLLEDSHKGIRYTVAEIISFSKTTPQEGIAVLLEFLQDPLFLYRMKAAQALGKAKVKVAIVPLIKLLQDPKPKVQAQAIWALGELEAKEALLHLEKNLASSYPFVRKAAEETIKKLKN